VRDPLISPLDIPSTKMGRHTTTVAGKVGLACCAAALWVSGPARADFAVIVHPSNPVASMSTKDVADLYLGRSRAFPSGEMALPFDQVRDSPVRGAFLYALTGMSLPQVNSHWSRLMFSAQMQPPPPIPDEQTARGIVARNPSAIAYIHADLVNSSVRVVLTVKE
jgi:hypothetical protein